MSAQGRWSDLAARTISAAVLVALTLGALLAGGVVWQGFVALISGVMVWELACMLVSGAAGAGIALLLATLTTAVVLPSGLLPQAVGLPLLALPGLLGAALMRRDRAVFAAYAMWIALAGFAFIEIRMAAGALGMAWLICVVVATDVAGYFAGKAIGGPKFWPRVSPRKTWSGTAAGWLAAALVGWGFSGPLGMAWVLILLSVLGAMAAQAGDIAESAIKRRAGIKDSSALIPGHGGFLDRFDGMIGAAVLVLLAGALTGFPPEGM